MKKIGYFLLVALLVAFFAVGGSTGKAVAADKRPIKIGAILNMTGAIAFIGPLFKNGIEHALKKSPQALSGLIDSF